jgi:hypothetical protein
MPVIIDPDAYDLWLDPGMNDANVVSERLKPFDARLMRCFPISTRINHVANADDGTTPISTPIGYGTAGSMGKYGIWLQNENCSYTGGCTP